ncbi:MAG: methyltransferase domain-containing protein [Deltaproteobacteria bacterium]|nr:methyltransferase domain-containing protein [Deltaproteobacteria bacterium]
MHKFDPQHIERLTSEERYREIRPEGILRDAGLKEGDSIADIGCGPGFFTIPASKIAGPTGLVYAIDTQEEMLASLISKGLPPNIIPKRSGEHSFPIEDGRLDFALIAYVLHETEDKTLFLKEVKRVLRAGGALLIIDWKKIKEEKGPPVEERLTEADCTGLLEDSGFSSIKSSSLNPSHYKVSAIK